MIRSRRRGGVPGTVVALALVACGGPPDDAPVVTVARGDFEDVLLVQGRLEASRTVSVQAGAHGKLSFMVAEGTVVAEGDPLFGLETQDMEERLEAALLDLAVAEAGLGKAEEESRLSVVRDELSRREKTAALDFARLRAEEARQELERKQRQVEAQIAPAADLTRAELAVQQADLQVANAEIDLQRLEEEIASRRETTQLERQSAQARLDKAESQVREAREYLERATVRAPRDGIVVHATNWRGETFQVGEDVWRNATVMELPDLSEMQVTVELNEADIARVTAGVPARVGVEAFPELILRGQVSEIAGLARELQDREGRGTGVRVFDVVVSLERQDGRLRPGMSAEVELVVDRREGVLLLPALALQGRAGAYHVVRADGRRGPVQVDALGADVVVVSVGLREGDEVVLLPDGEAAAVGDEGPNDARDAGDADGDPPQPVTSGDPGSTAVVPAATGAARGR